MHESRINDQRLVPKIVSLSHIGGRSTQQDHIWPLPNESISSDGKSDLLFVVADGAGGHKGGAVASQIAIETIVEQYAILRSKQKPKQALVNAIREAHETIQDRQQREIDKQNMASTVVALLLTPKPREKNAYYISVANVGDSRAYLYRPNFALTQLSEDHTLVQEEVRQHNLTPEQAKIHPLRHRLSQSLGGKKELSIYSRPLISVKPHDRYLLCTDGLTDVLDNAHIQAILSESASTAQVADMLMKQALLHAKDNVSFILLDLIPMPSDQRDQRAKGLIWTCLGSMLMLFLLLFFIAGATFYWFPEQLPTLAHLEVFDKIAAMTQSKSNPTETVPQGTYSIVSNRLIASKTLLPTKTALPTVTPEPTKTALPTVTPEPTKTALPTVTPEPTKTAAPTKTEEPTLLFNRHAVRQAATPVPSLTPTPPVQIVEYRTGKDRIVFESMVGWGGQNRACNESLSITKRLDFTYEQATRPVVEPIVEQRGADIYIKFDAIATNTRACGLKYYHHRVTTSADTKPGEWIIKNAKLTKKFAPSANRNKHVIPIDSNSNISRGGWIIGVDWQ